MNRKAAMVRSYAPQIHAPGTTRHLAWTMAACTGPAALWSVYSFGLPALVVMLVSIGAALLCEGAINLYRKDLTLSDGTAFLTGLLVAAGMPPGAPLYAPALGSAFAIVVVKWTFGGLGNNFMNPALTGKVVAFLSWPAAMGGWTLPQQLAGISGLSGATPLSFAQAGSGGIYGPMEVISSSGFPRSAMDASFTDWINANVLNPLGASMPGGYYDLFAGNVPGGLLEVSAAMILLGSIVLIARGVIAWEIPLSFLVAFAGTALLGGGLPFGTGLGTGDALFHLLTGGTLFAAFFFATDPVSTPLTRKGKLIFGATAGFLAMAFRIGGGRSESTALAILLMNCATLVLDGLLRNRRFGRSGGKA